MSVRNTFTIEDSIDTVIIPVCTKRLYYNRDKIIDFTIPPSVQKLYFSKLYKYSLDFITNTKIKILGWTFVPPLFINSLPDTIDTLTIGYLIEPLTYIPYNIKKIIIYRNPDTQLLSSSKFPFGCEIYYKIKSVNNVDKKYAKWTELIKSSELTELPE
jgi:hypothetical protein